MSATAHHSTTATTQQHGSSTAAMVEPTDLLRRKLIYQVKRGRFVGLVPIRCWQDPVTGKVFELLHDGPPPEPGFGEKLAAFENEMLKEDSSVQVVVGEGSVTAGLPPPPTTTTQQTAKPSLDNWIIKQQPSSTSSTSLPPTKLAPVFLLPPKLSSSSTTSHTTTRLPRRQAPLPNITTTTTTTTSASTPHQQVYVGDAHPHTFPKSVRARLHVYSATALGIAKNTASSTPVAAATSPPPRALAQEVLLWVRPPTTLRIDCNVALRQARALATETSLRLSALAIVTQDMFNSSPHHSAIIQALVSYRIALRESLGIELVCLKCPSVSEIPSVLANWTRKHNTMAVFTSDVYDSKNERISIAVARLCRAWHCPLFFLDSDSIAPPRAAASLLESAVAECGSLSLSLETQDGHVNLLKFRLESNRQHFMEVAGDDEALILGKSIIPVIPAFVDAEITTRWSLLDNDTLLRAVASEGERGFSEQEMRKIVLSGDVFVLTHATRMGMVSPLRCLLGFRNTVEHAHSQHVVMVDELLLRERLTYLNWKETAGPPQPQTGEMPVITTPLTATLCFPGDMAEGKTSDEEFNALQLLLRKQGGLLVHELRQWCRHLLRISLHVEDAKSASKSLLQAFCVGFDCGDVVRVCVEEFGV